MLICLMIFHLILLLSLVVMVCSLCFVVSVLFMSHFLCVLQCFAMLAFCLGQSVPISAHCMHFFLLFSSTVSSFLSSTSLLFCFLLLLSFSPLLSVFFSCTCLPEPFGFLLFFLFRLFLLCAIDARRRFFKFVGLDLARLH